MIVNLLNTFEEWLVEGNLVLKVGQHGLYLLLYLANLRCLVGLGQGEEHTTDAVEQSSAFLVGQDGILESSRVCIIYDSLDVVACLLDSELKSRQIVFCLNLGEVRGTKGECALLQ